MSESRITRWFRFHDNHSGGVVKINVNVWVQARTEFAACVRFEEATGFDPDWVRCSCCGPSFSYADDWGNPVSGDWKVFIDGSQENAPA